MEKSPGAEKVIDLAKYKRERGDGKGNGAGNNFGKSFGRPIISLEEKREAREHAIAEEIYSEIFKVIAANRSGPSEIIPPLTMAAQFGILMADTDLSEFQEDQGNLGYYGVYVDEETFILKHVIVYEKNIEPEWKRFFTAYSLGLHSAYQVEAVPLPTKATLVDTFSKDSREDALGKACELFAYEMLMPKDKFLDFVKFCRSAGMTDNEIIAKALAASDEFMGVPFVHVWQHGKNLGCWK